MAFGRTGDGSSTSLSSTATHMKVAFATREFLTVLERRVELFDELPEGAVPDVRLVYNTEAPADYQPPGFKGTGLGIAWQGGSRPMTRAFSAAIKTHHHT